MAGNSIRNLFEKQIHKQNVQNCNPTRAVKAEMLIRHERESTCTTALDENQFEYIILDDEGYVVNNFNDTDYVQDSVNSENRAATVLESHTSTANMNSNARTVEIHSQPANHDFIILDENVLMIDVPNNAGKYIMKVNINIQ